MKKKALIFGVTGQDGAYLAKLLIKKKYIVHGVKRRSSSINTSRVDHIYQEPGEKSRNFFLHYGDITDSTSVSKIIQMIKPHEIYNLAAQSHVAVSFEVPEYTANADALGTLRILEAIKFHKLEKKTKFYQAGTSEMYGKVQDTPQNEKTNFYPLSPYGVAKLYAHWITKNYREAYNIFGSNGILFNHESPRRGETFVTRKITMYFAKKILGSQDILYLGNLNAKRDWGHAKDYTEMQWKILQQKKPQDYVIATGKTMSVREFINECCKYLNLKIIWVGKGINEKGYIVNNKKKELVIKVDKKYYRPLEIDYLRGDPRKAFKELNYKLKHNLKDLVKDMIDSDIELFKKKNQ